jgi:hypothetical protein
MANSMPLNFILQVNETNDETLHNEMLIYLSGHSYNFPY